MDSRGQRKGSQELTEERCRCGGKEGKEGREGEGEEGREGEGGATATATATITRMERSVGATANPLAMPHL